MMRAVVLREYGPPHVLVQQEIADPQPAPGQLVVAVAAAGVNFVDTMLRSGRMAPLAGRQPPFVLGNEIGGTVTSVGPGVDPNLVGRQVLASLGGAGGYAEQAAVDADAVIPVPDGLDIKQAVALLAQGRTAVGLMREARVAAGERVLVEAAAGGVGSLLVQLARQAGAGTVVAAAHGQRKLELARRLGADVTIDYQQPDWDAQVRHSVGSAGLDVVFDSVGGTIGRTAFDLLADGGGRFVVFGFSSGTPTEIAAAEVLRRGLTVIGFGGARVLRRPGYHRELATEALQKAAAGELTPVIGQTFPLHKAADAHAAVETRATVGKTLLIP